jgi:hypothetical protein
MRKKYQKLTPQKVLERRVNRMGNFLSSFESYNPKQIEDPISGETLSNQLEFKHIDQEKIKALLGHPEVIMDYLQLKKTPYSEGEAKKDIYRDMIKDFSNVAEWLRRIKDPDILLAYHDPVMSETKLLDHAEQAYEHIIMILCDLFDREAAIRRPKGRPKSDIAIIMDIASHYKKIIGKNPSTAKDGPFSLIVCSLLHSAGRPSKDPSRPIARALKKLKS